MKTVPKTHDSYWRWKSDLDEIRQVVGLGLKDVEFHEATHGMGHDGIKLIFEDGTEFVVGGIVKKL